MTTQNIVKPQSANTAKALASAGLPIFFVQLGSHVNLFFEYVLQQAALTNGHQNVFVLTDAHTHLYKAYNCIDVTKYMQGRPFDELYRHHSTNKYVFEKACFDRWFIINELAREYNIPYFFHADCDVLILADLKPTLQYLQQQNYIGSTMYFEDGGRSITSGHSSFWSRDLLNEFCDFTCATYADHTAFNAILKQAEAGVFYDNTNVSDMILLDVFRREQKPHTLNLFELEDTGTCFDFNINAAYNGRRHQFLLSPVYHIKQMKRKVGGWYGLVKGGGNGTPGVKFSTLHFQGYLAKALIPQYVTSNNYLQKQKNRMLAQSTYLLRRSKLAKNRIRDMVFRLIKK